jgi:hypothetical protein
MTLSNHPRGMQSLEDGVGPLTITGFLHEPNH